MKEENDVKKVVVVISLLLAGAGVEAQDKAPRWVESIRVLWPAPCSEVSGRVKIFLQAKGMDHVEARCYVEDSKQANGKRQEIVLTPKGIGLDGNGEGAFWLNAKRLPHGPLSIQITGDNSAGERDVYELQLYNRGGKRMATTSIPDTIPWAARGMRLVFSYDFDGPLSISRDGRGARYNAHKPTFGISAAGLSATPKEHRILSSSATPI